MAIKLLKYEKDLSLMGNANTAVIVVSGCKWCWKNNNNWKTWKIF